MQLHLQGESLGTAHQPRPLYFHWQLLTWAAVNEGEADIGITSLTEIPNNLEFRPFARYKRFLIAPKNHPISRKTHITAKDICAYPLILAPKDSRTRSVAEGVFLKLGVSPNIAVEITGREALKTYVDLGLGISIIEEFYLSDEDRKRFSCIDVSKDFGSSEYGTLVRKNRYLSGHSLKFIEMLADRPAS
jgi:LysR family cys regulon transcriptional activator